jgi:hypothetical protein
MAIALADALTTTLSMYVTNSIVFLPAVAEIRFQFSSTSPLQMPYCIFISLFVIIAANACQYSGQAVPDLVQH